LPSSPEECITKMCNLTNAVRNDWAYALLLDWNTSSRQKFKTRSKAVSRCKHRLNFNPTNIQQLEEAM